MKKNVLLFFLAGLLIPLSPVSAGINFQGLDLSPDNRLLFRVSVSGSGASANAPNAVFMSRLSDFAMQQVTVFPERIDLVESGRSLLVRSALGAALVPVSGGIPRHFPGFPSFITGMAGSLADSLAVSSDGMWLLQIEPVSAAFGNLVLVEASSGRRRLVSQQIERPGRIFPACWSPDSRVFVYSKSGKLYYYSLATESTIEERFRHIGDGKINSVTWGRRGDFYYAKGNTLYHVSGPEILTRAIYADFLEIGTVVGKLPLEFNPDFDSFWMSPDSRSILLSKGGRNIFFYPLSGALADDISGNFALPYIRLPPGAFGVTVLWPLYGQLTLIVNVQKNNGLASFAWRLTEDGKQSIAFKPLEIASDNRYALSPDGSKVLAWGEQGLSVLDYSKWTPLGQFQAGKIFTCAWINNQEYIVANQWLIERVDASGSRHLVCLTGAQEYGFEEGASINRIFVKNNDNWYFSESDSPWELIAHPRIRSTAQASEQYRVYLERQSGFPYDNIPMIRSISSAGTMSLLPQQFVQSEASVREAADASASGVFSRGYESGPGEVALCFDLYDDDTGLSIALEALNRFGVKATFFMNGEFIRRHQDSARVIAESGHEAASMFYAPIDLSDSRYRIDADFITRGLARNEDEYFRASGAELNLLWHPPFYRESAMITRAALQAGYVTIGRDVDPMDWLNRDEFRRLGIGRETPPQIIDRIMKDKKSGSIIPIRLGIQPDGNDYLFLYLDVLLDALLRSGYSVVPVSTIVQRGR